MFFAKLHPLLVHFPAGLLVSGVVFELYGKIRGDETVATAGWFNTRLGFWCALPVMTVGLLGVLALDAPEKSKVFLGYHILSAFSTGLLFLAVLILGRFRGRRWGAVVYHLFLLFGLAAILSTGFFGGELVHRFGIATLHPLE